MPRGFRPQAGSERAALGWLFRVLAPEQSSRGGAKPFARHPIERFVERRVCGSAPWIGRKRCAVELEEPADLV